MFWMREYHEKFNGNFPIVIGWAGDWTAKIQECLKKKILVNVKKMESEIDRSVIY